MAFPELPFGGDPDPAGEEELPDGEFMSAEELYGDDTIDIDEQE